MQFVPMADNKLMSSRWPQTSRTIWPTLKYDLIITCSNHKNELLSMPSFALQSRRSFQPFLKILSILKFLIRLLTLSSINIPCMASRHKSLLGFQPTLLREGWWNRALIIQSVNSVFFQPTLLREGWWNLLLISQSFDLGILCWFSSSEGYPNDNCGIALVACSTGTREPPKRLKSL